jgi:ketosteroid isomerase-like protein
MKALLAVLIFTVSFPLFGQARNNGTSDEILKVEKEFGQAILTNDPDAIGRFLSDDWIIIDSDGGIIDKGRFLDVVKSGTLTHDAMDSDDVMARVYGDAATVTALTTTKGKYMGQEFTTRERATDFFVKKDGRWQCVLSQLTRLTKK